MDQPRNGAHRPPGDGAAQRNETLGNAARPRFADEKLSIAKGDTVRVVLLYEEFNVLDHAVGVVGGPLAPSNGGNGTEAAFIGAALARHVEDVAVSMPGGRDVAW